jgi:polysaccharide export outer membrane protein
MTSCASGPGQRVVAAPPPAPLRLPAGADWNQTFDLNVGDDLEVKFPYHVEFNERVQVRPDGKIALPLVGVVQAEGKTPDALQQDLADLYRRLPAPTAPAERKYRIHVNDELAIRFTNQKDFDDTVRVRPDGRISLPLVKSVIAEGKTPEDLETELIEAYRKHLKAPDLVVIVRNFTSQEFEAGGKTGRAPIRDLEQVAVLVRASAPRRLYVGGEVQRPGIIPFTPNVSALQAIFEAGGQKPSGKISQVIVLRRMDVSHPVAFFLDLKQDLRGHATNDILLKPSDVVVVPRTAVASLNQFLDQYLYSLLPITRNSSFNFIQNLNPASAVIPGAVVQ